MAGGPEKKLCVLVNAERVDFDGRLDYASLERVAEVRRHVELSDEAMPGELEGAEVMVTKEIPIRGDLIRRLPASVRLIAEAGTGFNNIDMEAARERGITVCNVPAYSNDAVAQLVITFVLNFSCSMIPQQRMLMRGEKTNFTKHLQVPHFELAGKTLGLIGGGGTIGSKVTDIALTLGMRILISSRNPKPSDREAVEITTMDDLLARSDFVSIHCPLTPETRHLMDAANLAKMKPTAFLINTARGAVCKEADLIEALRQGTIAGAGLDVQDPEPPADDNPLYTLENVVLTPHIGWRRLETRQRLMDMVADNVGAFLAGAPTNVVS